MKKTFNKKSPVEHRSLQQWKNIMQAYKQSELTQESFCQQESLAPSTFYNWQKRLVVT